MKLTRVSSRPQRGETKQRKTKHLTKKSQLGPESPLGLDNLRSPEGLCFTCQMPPPPHSEATQPAHWAIEICWWKPHLPKQKEASGHCSQWVQGRECYLPQKQHCSVRPQQWAHCNTWNKCVPFYMLQKDLTHQLGTNGRKVLFSTVRRPRFRFSDGESWNFKKLITEGIGSKILWVSLKSCICYVLPRYPQGTFHPMDKERNVLI